MKSLSFYEKEKLTNPRRIRAIAMWVFQIVVVIFIAGVSVYYFGQNMKQIGYSMEPVIQDGQEVWINKMSYLLSAPKRYDVIVFRPNGNKNTYRIIKRVIGLPGETVSIKDGKIFIDGDELNDDKGIEPIIDIGDIGEEFQLKEDEYFVLGDNRNSSEDSRYTDIGMVLYEYIDGRAWLCKEAGLKFRRIR